MGRFILLHIVCPAIGLVTKFQLSDSGPPGQLARPQFTDVSFVENDSSIIWFLSIFAVGVFGKRLIKYCSGSFLRSRSCVLTLLPPKYLIGIFTHANVCLPDAIHDFKWVKIILIWQNGVQRFWNLVEWCHVISWTCAKAGIYRANKKMKKRIYSRPVIKG